MTEQKLVVVDAKVVLHRGHQAAYVQPPAPWHGVPGDKFEAAEGQAHSAADNAIVLNGSSMLDGLLSAGWWIVSYQVTSAGTGAGTGSTTPRDGHCEAIVVVLLERDAA